MKRKWEEVMPPITDLESIKKREEIISAMERDEWAFREKVRNSMSAIIRILHK